MSQCGSGSDTSSSLLAWPPRLWRRAMAAPMAALGQDYRCGKGMESYTQSTCSSILIIAKLSPQHPLHCIGWVAPLPLFVPHRWHLHLSPQYDVLDHTNHIFSVRIWSWQYISVINHHIPIWRSSYIHMLYFQKGALVCYFGHMMNHHDHHIIRWWTSYHPTSVKKKSIKIGPKTVFLGKNTPFPATDFPFPLTFFR